MGLDITAYRQIKPVRKQKDADDYPEGHTRFWIIKDFAAVADDVKEKTLYSFTEDFGFRAGSYGGYNAWRTWLAGLVGTTPDAAWAGQYHGPFAELINFSDCEGVIGSKTAAKLAKDFAEFDAKAKAADKDGYNYGRYEAWRKAMEMAADGGAVSFH